MDLNPAGILTIFGVGAGFTALIFMLIGCRLDLNSEE